MTNVRTAQIDEIVAATVWNTSQLAAWALTWNQYGNNWMRYCWAAISSTQEEAREFYGRLAEETPEELRRCAAEALVDGGWTLRAINYRKS